ncbi:hypothetical protein KQ304_02350 [Synechococcus sp. CS-1329]|uniref:hypothetical protein n=1 Tax=Synechococcus sp. CS-1329 TaxID=2847975 RepID=UPI00223AE6E6|nr:hypothetical protein [Synechococcus sp. CS-1329]MCT0217844.1 hypothetical protein [Synechococcus sp. CS-1329]
MLMPKIPDFIRSSAILQRLKSRGNASDHIHRQTKLRNQLLIASLGLGVSVLLNYFNYRSYWKSTIYNTQTIDFNLLANVLPDAIKEPLQSDNQAQLSQLLNSHYNVFGILVSRCIDSTGCNAERFVAVSGFQINDNGKTIQLIKNEPVNFPISREWTKQLINQAKTRSSLVSYLKSQGIYNQGVYAKSNLPYFSFKHPGRRDPEVNTPSSTNQSTKIGNIYLIRNPGPPFLDDTIDIFPRLNSAWLNLPSFFSSRQGIVFLTYIGLPVLLLLIFELVELRSSQSKLAQQRKLDDDKISFFKTMYASDLLSTDIANFSHDLSTANQKVLDAMNELTISTRAEICTIFHDIVKAPLIQPGSITNNLINHNPLPQNSKTQEFENIINELKDTHEQIGFVVRDMRLASTVAETSVLSVNSILQSLTERLPATTSNRTTKLEIKIPNTSAYIKGNEWQLFGILRNILYNSLSALKMKKTSLPRSKRNLFNPEILIYSTISDEYVNLIIEDNGPGIPANRINTLYKWTPSASANLKVNKLSGYGSDIVGTYLMLNEAKPFVANLSGPSEPVSGTRIVLQFKRVYPSSSC